MSRDMRLFLWGFQAITLLLLIAPRGLEGQAQPPSRVTISVDPPWPGIQIEAVGMGASGVTGASGTVTLPVSAGTVEFRGTTPDGEVVSRIVDVARWSDQFTLSFPTLRALGATVMVRTLPGATVILDDRSPLVVGETGEVILRGLIPGRHTIRIRDPGSGRAVTRTVTAAGGTSALVEVPEAAWVSREPETPRAVEVEEAPVPFVEGIPSGSGVVVLEVSDRVQVLLQGALLGWAGPTEPLRIRLPAGPAELILVHSAGESRSLVTEVPDSEILFLEAEWVPIQDVEVRHMFSNPVTNLGLGFGVAISLTVGLTGTAIRRRRSGPTPPTTSSTPIANAPPAVGLAGTRFDRYTIQRYIGRGGMAAVYQAINEEGDACALKILEGSARSDPDLRRRFLRESRVLEKILATHPSAPIVRTFRYGTEDDHPEGVPFIELELLEGQSLLNCITEMGPPPVPVCVHILSEVARALSAAHDCGVLHRDLTPDNILIEAEQTATPRVRVIDFGVAKHELTQAHTIDGSIFGKPPYMAPEVWHHAELDARTDLYALGMVGYFLLTGTTPFSDPNPLVVMRMHEEAEVPELPPHIPPDLRRILRTLIQKSPEQRYPDAETLLFDLVAWSM